MKFTFSVHTGTLLVLLDFSTVKGLCLVKPLMRGGSLSDSLVLDAPSQSRLSKLPDAPAGGWHPPLTWTQRLTVALGALSGLAYLHTPDAVTHKGVVLHGERECVCLFVCVKNDR